MVVFDPLIAGQKLPPSFPWGGGELLASRSFQLPLYRGEGGAPLGGVGVIVEQ